MAALFQPYQRQPRALATAAVAVLVILGIALTLVLTLTEPTPAQKQYSEQTEAYAKTLAAFANTFAAEQAIADFAASQRQALLTTMAATLHQQIAAGADTVTLLRFAAQTLRLEAVYLLDGKAQTIAMGGPQAQPESFRELPEVRARLGERGGNPWLKRVLFPTKAAQPFFVLVWPRPQGAGFVVMVQTAENYQQFSDWSSLYTKFLERFLDGTRAAVYIALLEPNDQISYVVSRDAAEVARLKREHLPFKTLARSRKAQITELESSRGERFLELAQPYFVAGEQVGDGASPRGILIAGFRMQGGRPLPNFEPSLIVGLIATVALLGVLHWFCRRTAAATARRLEGDTQNILETISGGVLAINSDAVVVAVNRRLEDITGRSRADALGHPYQRAFENEKELNYVLMDTLHNGQLYTNHELSFHKADGTTVPLRVSTARLELSGAAHPGAIALVEDMSEQRRLEARLRRNERLSAMGQLAHGVAHEIRNPLNAIEMTVQRIQSQFKAQSPEEDDKFQRYFRAIREEVRRLDQIIRRFLELARPPETSLSEVDINGLVEHALLLQEEEFRRQGIQVAKSLSTNLPRIKADKVQLQQGLLNLVLNAVQATAGLPKDSPRVIKLTTAFVPAEAPDEADGVEITVSDNGVGIKPEHKERIFDPYFTTKHAGSGLGLALVHSITLNHGGLIEFESAPGAGTTFRWLLPVEFGETL
jgi:PAS domain S-box-containing protein